jgi:hypothetical protein
VRNGEPLSNFSKKSTLGKFSIAGMYKVKELKNRRNSLAEYEAVRSQI